MAHSDGWFQDQHQMLRFHGHEAKATLNCAPEFFKLLDIVRKPKKPKPSEPSKTDLDSWSKRL